MAAICFALCLACTRTLAATYTVVTTAYGNIGDGISLQWAMQQAINTPGIDIVAFNIAGPAPHVLNVSPGFACSSDFNIVDGSTQPANGFTGTTPKIIIDAGNQSGVFVGTNFLNIRLQGLWFRNWGGTVVTNNGSSDSVVISRCRFTNCQTAVFVNGFNHYTRVEHCFVETSTSYGVGSNGVYNRYDIIDNRFEGNFGDGVFHNGVGWVHNSRGNVYLSNGSGIGGNGSGFIYSHNDWIALNRNNGISMNGFDYTLVADSSKIGIDSLGQSSMGNTGNGIFINGSSSTTFDIRHCIISGNGGNGISCNGTLDTALFYNNWIGTDITGTLDRGNAQAGISISGYVEVGGVGKGNVISGNNSAGVYNSGPKSIFQGNFIGTDVSGTLLIPNNDDGLIVGGDSCRIGGIGPGEGNTIAFNLGDGITVTGQNNPIRRNRTYCNAAKGIQLNNIGNASYPVPTITSLGVGVIGGVSNPKDTIEIFERHSCPCPGQGQGMNYVGTAVADALGNWVYSGTFPANVTATATDSAGYNTSEFSSCAVVLEAQIALQASPTADRKAYLWWEIPADMPVASWELERSTDAQQFAVFTDRTARGAGRIAFEQWDAAPPAATVWYRLRTYDHDGNLHISEARKVDFPSAACLQAWPNPASDRLSVAVAGFPTGAARLDLVDGSGKVIGLWSGRLDATRLELQLALPPLSKGLYLLRLQDGGIQQLLRLVVE